MQNISIVNSFTYNIAHKENHLEENMDMQLHTGPVSRGADDGLQPTEAAVPQSSSKLTCLKMLKTKKRVNLKN